MALEQLEAKMARKEIDAQRLRELGFPEKVIAEAQSAAKLGLFDLKPSPGLTERTISRCIANGLLPSVKERSHMRRLIDTIFRLKKRAS